MFRRPEKHGNGDNTSRDDRSVLPTMQLLDRVSISNLVDLFSLSGRRKLLRTLFARSELVEPTYEEVRGDCVSY